VSEIYLKKINSVLAAIDDEGTEFISKLKTGNVYRVSIVRPRNSGFHRKFFVLLNLAYDAFEPESATYKGVECEKNRETFRSDIIILAGYYTASIRLNGDPIIKAKSISFGSMKQDEFEELYSKVIDVILARVMTNYTRDDLNDVVDEILRF